MNHVQQHFNTTSTPRQQHCNNTATTLQQHCNDTATTLQQHCNNTKLDNKPFDQLIKKVGLPRGMLVC